MRLVIVLSTYNGATYLSAQLDSILQQQTPCDALIIRDDGSTDNTLSILKRYQQNYPQISLYVDNLGHIGLAKSYESLLKYALTLNSQFIMYADQDDVWLPHKTEVLLRRIALLNNNQPALVFSDATLVDENLNVIASSFRHFQKFRSVQHSSLKALLLFSPALGCCMIFNQKLLLKITSYPASLFPYPDKLALMIAVCFGEAVYLPEQTVLYRQHQHNTSSALKGIHRPISLAGFSFLQTRYQAAVNEAQTIITIIPDLNEHDKTIIQHFILLFTGNYLVRILNYFKFWLLPPHRHRKTGLLLSLLLKFK